MRNVYYVKYYDSPELDWIGIDLDRPEPLPQKVCVSQLRLNAVVPVVLLPDE